MGTQRMNGASALAAALLLAMTMAPAQATVAWDENVNDDLSNDRLAPTPVSFVAGANRVLGTIGASDPDYFTFVVPIGSRLTAIQLNPGSSVSGGSSFIAIQLGNQVTTTPTGQNVGALLTFNHYSTDAIGTNLLGSVLTLPGGATSLASGSYAVWLNETGGTVPYSFDFVLTAVPEPASAAMLLAGLMALGLRRRK